MLTTIMATPTSPSLPSLPLSYSPPSDSSLTVSAQFYPSPSSPCFPICHNSITITSPEKSDATPYPASSITSAKLAHLLEQSKQRTVSAGSRRPLILDLRSHPDFYPLSITDSININLPTLLMRRYRRGGAVSSFALESFITIPSDVDLFHEIQDSWRTAATSSTEPHDVIVLDQDMKAGEEEYGRSATAAWTLLNVLERGIGNDCFNSAPIRLWYLEGGFDAFQLWDVNEKHLTRSGVSTSASMSPDMHAVDQDVEMTLVVPEVLSTSGPTKTKPALAIDTSVSSAPKQRVRRESLFSLNTKSLQRPAEISRARSQTVNLKPLAIPFVNNSASSTQQQQQQASRGGWLAVPSSMAAPAPSPVMSMISNHSMEISHSASTDHSSSWSADSSSVNGSGHFPLAVPSSHSTTLSTKRSISSLLTLTSIHASSTTASIREEDEDRSESGSGSRTLHIPYSSHQWGHDSPKDHSTRSCTESLQSMNQEYSHHSNMQDQHSISDRSVITEEDENSDDNEQEISCILPNFLYLGPEIVNEAQVKELDLLGVKRILNMATECEDALVSNRQGMEYHKIGVYDNIDADVGAGLLRAVDIIAASPDAPIYVHCKAGKSRSVTATIAYMITKMHWPLNKAYQHVLTHRPCMCPNIGFVTELMRIEERTLGTDKAAGIQVAQVIVH
ncbi:hypothetical protein BC939DRAFT_31283 [Gamsiella multidivaricata]|uniref:uncharacterized protein n=1 Tax=Gamsiella multidivaricata TaxID=101098 RepID=UPI00221EF0A3|nr:uncharacterized protein BC939DRAFT_31283 [Gamsiella multidivaricata]KAI7816783.1 hypothetical protein BC939DRAFT_31283 [Gamsiella multidivaricata]